MWKLLESDPGVFFELSERYGVKGLGFEEVYDLDSQTWPFLDSILAFVFLFPYNPKLATTTITEPELGSGNVSDIWFARQVPLSDSSGTPIENSCATNALLNIVMNLPWSQEKRKNLAKRPTGKKSIGVKVEGPLSEFRAFTLDMDAQMKGVCLANSEALQNIHNSMANNCYAESSHGSLADKHKDESKSADPFHFVAIFPKNDAVFLLDGLRSTPLRLASIPPRIGASASDGAEQGSGDGVQLMWVKSAMKFVQRHIAAMHELQKQDDSHKETDIRFNLIAVVKDPKEELEANKAHLQERIGGLIGEILRMRGRDDLAAQFAFPAAKRPSRPLETETPPLPLSAKAEPPLEGREGESLRADLVRELKVAKSELACLNGELEAAKERQRKWRLENSLRRMDMTPIFLNLILGLKESKELLPFYEEALQKYQTS